MGCYAGISATMIETRSPAQRRELGDFVRTQRERLDPAAPGLLGVARRHPQPRVAPPPRAPLPSPRPPRRRTPGLRREEVALLCGLSTTWYTWIEQGRDVSVSPPALARLAATLRLGRAERAYL